MNDIINLKPLKAKRISPRKFLKLSSGEKRNIERTRFIPPELGEPGFGFFEIVFRKPVYQNTHGQKQTA